MDAFAEKYSKGGYMIFSVKPKAMYLIKALQILELKYFLPHMSNSFSLNISKPFWSHDA